MTSTGRGPSDCAACLCWTRSWGKVHTHSGAGSSVNWSLEHPEHPAPLSAPRGTGRGHGDPSLSPEGLTFGSSGYVGLFPGSETQLRPQTGRLIQQEAPHAQEALLLPRTLWDGLDKFSPRQKKKKKKIHVPAIRSSCPTPWFSLIIAFQCEESHPCDASRRSGPKLHSWRP